MKIKRIFPLVMCALLAVGLTSCSGNDAPEVVVEDSDVANLRSADATYNSLSFAWDRVKGVNQYGYRLTGFDGMTVDEGVTQLNEVTFSDLSDDAEYTFELRVYGSNGEPSYRTTLKVKTMAIRQLATPQPVAEQKGNKISLTWDAVEGAYAYLVQYVIGENELSQTVSEPACAVAGLAPGEHTLSVTALSDYGGYTTSETKKIVVKRSRKEVGTVSGTYTSGIIRRNNSWPCTMRVYDDDTYTIEAFYQGEGYNLELYVDSNPETGEKFLGVYNFVSFPDAAYYVLDTGRASVPQIELIPGLNGSSYGSTFSGDATSGTLTIDSRYTTVEGTEKFEW